MDQQLLHRGKNSFCHGNNLPISSLFFVIHRKNGNKSVTMLNVSVNHRMSVFEPSPMRDTIQHFCEKHLKKIQSYMQSVSSRLPTPVKLSIEEKCGKKFAKLSFAW